MGQPESATSYARGLAMQEVIWSLEWVFEELGDHSG